MTREVAAACAGAVAAGAEDILLKDAHDTARNLDPTALPRETRILRGWTGDPLSMMSGLDSAPFGAVLFTGYHAWAACPGNPLSHTMNPVSYTHLDVYKRQVVKTKKAGLLTKIVVLALLIYLATSLLNLQGQIASAQAERDDLSRQVAAQTQANADLADDVENSGDPERIQDIARDRLGLAAPDERIFIASN